VDGDGNSEPEPFGAFCVIDGDAARFTSVPTSVDRCFACQVTAPRVELAVAPAPPPAVEP
jgi:hypothetical protein